jgi:hypothetical protein
MTVTADRNGCTRAVVALPVLLVLSPLAIAVRRWRAWRRGQELRFRCASESTQDADALCKIEVDIDVPHGQTPELRRGLTDIVVRIAEHLAGPGADIHQLYRLPHEPESVAIAVGPRLQAFGDRMLLSLQRPVLASRTVLWLALPRAHRLAELLEPTEYDPEAAGEPEGVVRSSNAVWAVAIEWMDAGPAIIMKLVFFVPVSSRSEVVGLLEALER